MPDKIMVLFDSLSVRPEAVHYSIQLAKRMEYSLIILMLLALHSQEVECAPDFDLRIKETLRDLLYSARQAGVQVEAEVRMGNPSSELMKFMAGSRSVQTIVWGGPPELSSRKWNKDHWLMRMKDGLGCPIVIPARKS